MRRKKLKLQNQDEEIRNDITDEPQLFKGMVIHVRGPDDLLTQINGYTKPPREDLHHLIVKHGGVYKQVRPTWGR
jgi:DNA repair protein REV1